MDWEGGSEYPVEIIATDFSVAAEIKRDLIWQRTTVALRFKKAHGIKLDRPPRPGRVKQNVYRREIEGNWRMERR